MSVIWMFLPFFTVCPSLSFPLPPSRKCSYYYQAYFQKLSLRLISLGLQYLTSHCFSTSLSLFPIPLSMCFFLDVFSPICKSGRRQNVAPIHRSEAWSEDFLWWELKLFYFSRGRQWDETPPAICASWLSPLISASFHPRHSVVMVTFDVQYLVLW